METSFETLTPLARAAVPDHSARFDPERVLWEELIPGGAHWSAEIGRASCRERV